MVDSLDCRGAAIAELDREIAEEWEAETSIKDALVAHGVEPTPELVKALADIVSEYAIYGPNA